MKATKKIELIGDNIKSQARFYTNMINDAFDGVGDALFGEFPSCGWIAEITGLSKKYGFERSFLPYKKDYTKSNSNGSRGVYSWFILDSGKYYEVYEKTSWRSVDRYFCMVTDDGEILRVSKEEVFRWAKSISE